MLTFCTLLALHLRITMCMSHALTKGVLIHAKGLTNIYQRRMKTAVFKKSASIMLDIFSIADLVPEP